MMSENEQLEMLIDALDSVTWYNGYYEVIEQWINDLKDRSERYGYYLRPDAEPDGGLEVIWMLCVCMFGDYGTSPRRGWIEDFKGCHDFLVTITKTAKENPEEEDDAD